MATPARRDATRRPLHHRQSHDTAHNAANACSVGNSKVLAWPEADLGQWDVREFAGASEYNLTEQDGLRVLDARTDGKASVLYREKEVDLNATPILNWSWQVDAVYDNPDEQSKAGDDFPARLYVVIQTGAALMLPAAGIASSATSRQTLPQPFRSSSRSRPHFCRAMRS